MYFFIIKHVYIIVAFLELLLIYAKNYKYSIAFYYNLYNI